jgi:hypothetical protein
LHAQFLKSAEKIHEIHLHLYLVQIFADNIRCKLETQLSGTFIAASTKKNSRYFAKEFWVSKVSKHVGDISQLPD